MGDLLHYDMDILQEIISALQSQERVMLATIISTTGSTPASALSKMLVKDNGKSWLGTVGGGCLEGDVLQEAIQMYSSGTAKILTFHLNETNIDQGLICGGSLDVLIEPLTKRDISVMQEVRALRNEGNDCVIATFLSPEGAVEEKVCLTRTTEPNNGTAPLDDSLKRVNALLISPEAAKLKEAISKAGQRNETQRVVTTSGEMIVEPVSGTPHLVIFGGGHVSKYISRAASMAGFRITVIDDRSEYANAVRFPEAERTLAVDFNEALSHISVTPSTYIVIVTRGHRSDEEILEKVAALPAKYIGMIGSKRKVLTTYEHLAERGVSADVLNRVHAPIGIEIGATTAEEIGISVVAQLIAVRRGEVDVQKNMSEPMKSLITQIGR
jgi:Xanthine and CO dehydrogenases maturation factor, XdhC/CoxF family